MSSFRSLLPPAASVLRSSQWIQTPASALTIGDIVRVSLGTRIPADLRILANTNLRVDNSMLTGESEPVTSSTQCTSRNYLESRNVVFFGSSVVEGTAIAVVINVGDNTVMGKISQLTNNQSTNQTTSLHREIDRFVFLVCCCALTVGVICTIGWAAWVRVNYPMWLTWQSLIVTLLSLIVAFVPEGLPLAVTMMLSIVAKRMFAHQILIKDLAIIETFNMISLICSDKTGTITENKLTVSKCLWGRGKDRGYVPTDAASNAAKALYTINNPRDDASFYHLYQCAVLANNCVVKPSANSDKPELDGDASDCALHTFFNGILNVDNERLLRYRVAQLPFNSTNKYMISVNVNDDDKHGARQMYLKGAPEIIINKCNYVYDDDGVTVRPLTDADRHAWAVQQETLGDNGERVLAFATQRLDPATFNSTYVYEFDSVKASPYPDAYIFLGYISFLDPPRATVAASLAKCRTAHIKVAMVTGDHPTTAKAIGKQIGLISSDRSLNSFNVKKDRGDRMSLVLMTDGKEIGMHTYVQSSDDKKRVLDGSQQDEEDDAATERVKLFRSFSSMDESPSTVSSVFKQDQEGSSPSNNKQHSLNIENDVDEYLYSGPSKARIQSHSIIVTGAQIPLFDDLMWKWVMRHDEIIFARTTPEQKLQIVLHGQMYGDSVAVTGDGVNDSPALRASNLGIAMQAGSEVAREASDIILLNNDFTSVVTGIELGRVVFDNLKKVCIYLLPAGTFSEMLTVICFLFLGFQSMLSNFQMLMISCSTDICVSLAMVNESPESDIMTRKPRNRKDRLVNLKLIFTAYCFQGVISFFAALINYLWWCSDNGLPAEAVYNGWNWGSQYPDVNANVTYDAFGNAQAFYYGVNVNDLPNIVNVGESIFFVTLVITQWGNALAIRTRTQSIITHNPFYGPHANLSLPLSFIGAFLFLILFTEASFFQTVFLTASVPIKYALVACVWGLLIIVLDEIRKYFVRNYPNCILAKVAW